MSRGYWLYIYSISLFVIILSFGLHVVFSRYYIKSVYGYEYNLVIMLGAVELSSSISSLFIGIGADILGRRKILLLGYIGPMAYFLISILGIKYIIPLIFLAGIGESILLTSSAGIVLDKGGSTGSYYAIYSAGMPIGWGLSGLIFPMLPYDISIYYKIIALLETTSVTLLYICYPGGDFTKVSLRDIINSFKYLGKILILFSMVIILLSSSIEFFWNGFYFKLLDLTGGDPIFFGLIYNTSPAIFGFIGRFMAGYLVDKYDPWYTLTLTPLILIIISTGMYLLSGYILIILWLIPVYALYEVSTTISVSRLLSKAEQASAVGVVTVSRSIGGLLMFLLSSITLFSLGNVYMTILQLSIAVFVILLLYRFFKRS